MIWKIVAIGVIVLLGIVSINAQKNELECWVVYGAIMLGIIAVLL